MSRSGQTKRAEAETQAVIDAQDSPTEAKAAGGNVAGQERHKSSTQEPVDPSLVLPEDLLDSTAGLAATSPQPQERAAEHSIFTESTSHARKMWPQAIGAGAILVLLSVGTVQYASGGWPFVVFSTADSEWRVGIEKLVASQAVELAELQTHMAMHVAGADVKVLQAQIDELRPIVTDLAALQVEIEMLDSGQKDLVAQLAQLDKKLAVRPAVSVVSSVDLKRQANLVKTLQSEIAAQKEVLASLSADLAKMGNQARLAAQKSLTKGSISQLIGALESGAPFAFAIADFADMPGAMSPALLAAAPYGVPTIATLLRDFPEQARLALFAARKDMSENSATTLKIGNFLRNQLGMRSLTPQSGDGPDAVLSRVEAALQDRQVANALGELEALPEVAKKVMSGWIERAELRRVAQQAVVVLSQKLLED